MDIRIILSPLMGALIGYVTNDLAIRMLFRPDRALYAGRFHIPMTPGLIPRERARIAAAIGDVIRDDLLDETTLLNALTSDRLRDKAHTAAREFLRREQEDMRTIGQALAERPGSETLLERVKERASVFLAEQLESADAGEMAARLADEAFQEKSPELLRNLFHGSVDEKLRQGLRQQIRPHVNAYIRAHSPQMARELVEREADSLLGNRLCDLAATADAQIDRLESALAKGYESLLRRLLPGALRGLDIAAIVREKIDSISNRQLEEMIFSVAGRELKAIVHLGALLGFLMGFLNLIWT